MMRMYLTLQGIDQKKIESPHGFRTKFVPEVCTIKFKKYKKITQGTSLVFRLKFVAMNIVNQSSPL